MARKRVDRDTKRIALPSGKTVEVVRTKTPDAAATPTTGVPGGDGPGDRAGEPHVCPLCDSTLVYPTASRPVHRAAWEVDLRCPNCELTRAAMLEQGAAERFDEELERGAETLAEDLAHLSEANMAEDVERFVAALEADAVLPVDF
jgi:hypothetical protein